MWSLIVIPIFLVFLDYYKAPIDRLYFNNPRRPLIGIRNTFRDIIHYFDENKIEKYPGLLLLKLHYQKIREEFDEISPKLLKEFQHDKDKWFEKNEGYYHYEVCNFPLLNSLIKQIPCINSETAMFFVIDGPMSLAPHRAESNEFLRYQLTIHGDGDCTLYTEKGEFIQNEGEDFLFDHGRYHELVKTGKGRRVLLSLDIYR